MTEQEVITLMKSSSSESEWNSNADTVKSKCDGYPGFWFSAIVMSGLMGQVSAQW